MILYFNILYQGENNTQTYHLARYKLNKYKRVAMDAFGASILRINAGFQTSTLNGRRGGTRTHTFGTLEPKSSASSNSATRPY